MCFTCFVHNLQQRGSRIHKRHWIVGFKRKHASSTNVTSASVVVTQFSSVMLGVLIDTCLCFRRHVPGLCRVVHDLFPDSMLLASCSYFAQHLFVHQVEGNTSQRAPLSAAAFRPYNQIVVVWHLVWQPCETKFVETPQCFNSLECAQNVFACCPFVVFPSSS